MIILHETMAMPCSVESFVAETEDGFVVCTNEDLDEEERWHADQIALAHLYLDHFATTDADVLDLNQEAEDFASANVLTLEKREQQTDFKIIAAAK